MASNNRRGVALLAGTLLVGVPVLVFLIQARHSGLSAAEQWQQLASRFTRSSTTPVPSGGTQASRLGELTPFLEPRAIGAEASAPPRLANCRSVDLDGDGRLDVLVADALANRVGWLRQLPDHSFSEASLPFEIPAPAHVEALDADRDGDLDVLVASMGMLFPNNDRIGAVIVLENLGEGTFRQQIAAARIARVTDVRGGDLDGDGDIDLVAGQFGYDDGEIRWLEARGGWVYESHVLLRLSGTIHAPVADLDGDGDLDIVALVSQEWEEIYLFENDGRGHFTNHLIYGNPNEDYGSSSIELVDLDGDGDQDILYTNGDAFDYIPPRPRPWHGLQWLENQGGNRFVFHRLGDVPGAAAAKAADFDRDGDLDILVSSAYNLWESPEAFSLLWFENQGGQSFVLHPVARSPTHLITLDVADLDGDGWVDAITGGMHVYPPYDRLGRVTWWRNRGPAVPAGISRRPGATPAAGLGR